MRTHHFFSSGFTERFWTRFILVNFQNVKNASENHQMDNISRGNSYETEIKRLRDHFKRNSTIDKKVFYFVQFFSDAIIKC